MPSAQPSRHLLTALQTRGVMDLATQPHLAAELADLVAAANPDILEHAERVDSALRPLWQVRPMGLVRGNGPDRAEGSPWPGGPRLVVVTQHPGLPWPVYCAVGSEPPPGVLDGATAEGAQPPATERAAHRGLGVSSLMRRTGAGAGRAGRTPSLPPWELTVHCPAHNVFFDNGRLMSTFLADIVDGPLGHAFETAVGPAVAQQALAVDRRQAQGPGGQGQSGVSRAGRRIVM